MTRVRPAVVVDGLAEVQVRWPSVPIVFTETRPLAQEWTYRWLAAALEAAAEDVQGADRLADLTVAGQLTPARWPAARAKPVPAGPPSAAQVRAWARAAGLDVGDRGRLPPKVIVAYTAEHRGPSTG